MRYILYIKKIVICILLIIPLFCRGQNQITRHGSSQNNESKHSEIRTVDNKRNAVISDPRLLTDYSQIKIGDWMTEDGRYSHEKISGISYVGVVFSLNPSLKDKTKGWTHGYIVALEDAKRGKCPWGPKKDIAEIPNMDYLSTSKLMNDKDGYYYTNCPPIKLSSKNAFYYACNYSANLPDSFSSWFLPSVGLWVEIISNLGKVEVSKAVRNTSTGYSEIMFDSETALCNLQKYGFKVNDCYWTSNESEKVEGYLHEAWVIWLSKKFNSDYSYFYVLVKETSLMNVRAVAAF